jgi:hypothetical protein
MSKSNGWVTIDPHSPFWDTLTDEAVEDEPIHPTNPTYLVTIHSTYRICGVDTPTTRTVYTNRKPTINTQPEEATS